MTTTRFNPVEYFETSEETAQYLTEAFADEDPSVFVIALGHVIRHHGVADVAQRAGVNRESLYKTIQGKTKPRWDTMHKLMMLFNVRLSVSA